MLVLDVAANQPALIRGVLQPLDELAAGAGKLALLGHRREPGEDQHGNAAPGGVVHRAAEILGTAFHMHKHRLWFAADLCIPVGGAQRHALVRAQDQLGKRGPRPRPARPRVRLQDAGVITAEVRERITHPGLAHRLKERRAGRVGGFGHHGAPWPAGRTRYPTGSAPMPSRYQAPYWANTCWAAKKMTAPMIGPSMVPRPPMTTMNSMSAL